MNKSEIHDLFKIQLYEINEFKKQIDKIEKIIYLIIENIDLLKDDVTDEQIGEVSSEIDIKIAKINSMIIDILSDSKKLESFLHEIKLLKRKRDKKLIKNKPSDDEDLKKRIDMLKIIQSNKQNIIDLDKDKRIRPSNPWYLK